MTKLLIVDDEENVRYSLEKALTTDGRQILTAATAGEALELVNQQQPDVVLLDIRLPDMSGLDAFAAIRRIDSRLPVVLITAHGTTETAIEAMKQGAFEYLLKPVDVGQLRSVVGSAIELSRLSRVPATFDQEKPSDAAVDRIVGLSPVMQKVYKDIGRVAPQDVNVLILGESGTGKELVARAIYQHSARADKPFLAINCAAIPEPLLESEVFGHEKGAFTGADRQRIGKFEQADHGTIFLDEIGDMALATQSKMLRLLQDGRFERVGGNKTIETDVRLIAATNQDLGKLISEGRFRQDLFYRLKVFSIQLPPLRRRLDDLPMLVDHFLAVFNAELGKHIRTVAPETLRVLKSYDWPGNVRELQGALKYAMVNAQGDVIVPDHFPEACRGGSSPRRTGSENQLDVVRLVHRLLGEGESDIYHQVQTAVDRAVLEEVLNRLDGNQVEAARVLGISRTTLRSKLSVLDLSFEKHIRPGSGHADH
jgi:nitrogen regulation protein NR(I)